MLVLKSEGKTPKEVLPIKNKNKLVTLKGIIIPVNWDNKGQVAVIAISTHGEDEYLIYDDFKGKKLFNFIQELVTVKGEIKEVAGIKQIKIIKMEKCISDTSNNI